MLKLRKLPDGIQQGIPPIEIHEFARNFLYGGIWVFNTDLNVIARYAYENYEKYVVDGEGWWFYDIFASLHNADTAVYSRVFNSNRNFEVPEYGKPPNGYKYLSQQKLKKNNKLEGINTVRTIYEKNGFSINDNKYQFYVYKKEYYGDKVDPATGNILFNKGGEYIFNSDTSSYETYENRKDYNYYGFSESYHTMLYDINNKYGENIDNYSGLPYEYFDDCFVYIAPDTNYDKSGNVVEPPESIVGATANNGGWKWVATENVNEVPSYATYENGGYWKWAENEKIRLLTDVNFDYMSYLSNLYNITAADIDEDAWAAGGSMSDYKFYQKAFYKSDSGGFYKHLIRLRSDNRSNPEIASLPDPLLITDFENNDIMNIDGSDHGLNKNHRYYTEMKSGKHYENIDLYHLIKPETIHNIDNKITHRRKNFFTLQLAAIPNKYRSIVQNSYYPYHYYRMAIMHIQNFYSYRLSLAMNKKFINWVGSRSYEAPNYSNNDVDFWNHEFAANTPVIGGIDNHPIRYINAFDIKTLLSYLSDDNDVEKDLGYNLHRNEEYTKSLQTMNDYVDNNNCYYDKDNYKDFYFNMFNSYTSFTEIQKTYPNFHSGPIDDFYGANAQINSFGNNYNEQYSWHVEHIFSRKYFTSLRSLFENSLLDLNYGLTKHDIDGDWKYGDISFLSCDNIITKHIKLDNLNIIKQTYNVRHGFLNFLRLYDHNNATQEDITKIINNYKKINTSLENTYNGFSILSSYRENPNDVSKKLNSRTEYRRAQKNFFNLNDFSPVGISTFTPYPNNIDNNKYNLAFKMFTPYGDKYRTWSGTKFGEGHNTEYNFYNKRKYYGQLLNASIFQTRFLVPDNDLFLHTPFYHNINQYGIACLSNHDNKTPVVGGFFSGILFRFDIWEYRYAHYRQNSNIWKAYEYGDKIIWKLNLPSNSARMTYFNLRDDEDLLNYKKDIVRLKEIYTGNYYGTNDKSKIPHLYKVFETDNKPEKTQEFSNLKEKEVNLCFTMKDRLDENEDRFVSDPVKWSVITLYEDMCYEWNCYNVGHEHVKPYRSFTTSIYHSYYYRTPLPYYRTRSGRDYDEMNNPNDRLGAYQLYAYSWHLIYTSNLDWYNPEHARNTGQDYHRRFVYGLEDIWSGVTNAQIYKNNACFHAMQNAFDTINFVSVPVLESRFNLYDGDRGSYCVYRAPIYCKDTKKHRMSFSWNNVLNVNDMDSKKFFRGLYPSYFYSTRYVCPNIHQQKFHVSILGLLTQIRGFDYIHELPYSYANGKQHGYMQMIKFDLKEGVYYPNNHNSQNKYRLRTYFSIFAMEPKLDEDANTGSYPINILGDRSFTNKDGKTVNTKYISFINEDHNGTNIALKNIFNVSDTDDDSNYKDASKMNYRYNFFIYKMSDEEIEKMKNKLALKNRVLPNEFKVNDIENIHFGPLDRQSIQTNSNKFNQVLYKMVYYYDYRAVYSTEMVYSNFMYYSNMLSHPYFETHKNVIDADNSRFRYFVDNMSNIINSSYHNFVTAQKRALRPLMTHCVNPIKTVEIPIMLFEKDDTETEHSSISLIFDKDANPVFETNYYYPYSEVDEDFDNWPEYMTDLKTSLKKYETDLVYSVNDVIDTYNIKTDHNPNLWYRNETIDLLPHQFINLDKINNLPEGEDLFYNYIKRRWCLKSTFKEYVPEKGKLFNTEEWIYGAEAFYPLYYNHNIDKHEFIIYRNEDRASLKLYFNNLNRDLYKENLKENRKNLNPSNFVELMPIHDLPIIVKANESNKLRGGSYDSETFQTQLLYDYLDLENNVLPNYIGKTDRPKSQLLLPRLELTRLNECEMWHHFSLENDKLKYDNEKSLTAIKPNKYRISTSYHRSLRQVLGCMATYDLIMKPNTELPLKFENNANILTFSYNDYFEKYRTNKEDYWWFTAPTSRFVSYDSKTFTSNPDELLIEGENKFTHSNLQKIGAISSGGDHMYNPKDVVNKMHISKGYNLFEEIHRKNEFEDWLLKLQFEYMNAYANKLKNLIDNNVSVVHPYYFNTQIGLIFKGFHKPFLNIITDTNAKKPFYLYKFLEPNNITKYLQAKTSLEILEYHNTLSNGELLDPTKEYYYEEPVEISDNPNNKPTSNQKSVKKVYLTNDERQKLHDYYSNKTSKNYPAIIDEIIAGSYRKTLQFEMERAKFDFKAFRNKDLEDVLNDSVELEKYYRTNFDYENKLKLNPNGLFSHSMDTYLLMHPRKDFNIEDILTRNTKEIVDPIEIERIYPVKFYLSESIQDESYTGIRNLESSSTTTILENIRNLEKFRNDKNLIFIGRDGILYGKTNILNNEKQYRYLFATENTVSVNPQLESLNKTQRIKLSTDESINVTPAEVDAYGLMKDMNIYRRFIQPLNDTTKLTVNMNVDELIMNSNGVLCLDRRVFFNKGSNFNDKFEMQKNQSMNVTNTPRFYKPYYINGYGEKRSNLNLNNEVNVFRNCSRKIIKHLEYYNKNEEFYAYHNVGKLGDFIYDTTRYYHNRTPLLFTKKDQIQTPLISGLKRGQANPFNFRVLQGLFEAYFKFEGIDNNFAVAGATPYLIYSSNSFDITDIERAKKEDILKYSRMKSLGFDNVQDYNKHFVCLYLTASGEIIMKMPKGSLVDNTKYNQLWYNNLLGFPVLYENDEFMIKFLYTDERSAATSTEVTKDLAYRSGMTTVENVPFYKRNPINIFKPFHNYYTQQLNEDSFDYHTFATKLIRKPMIIALSADIDGNIADFTVTDHETNSYQIFEDCYPIREQEVHKSVKTCFLPLCDRRIDCSKGKLVNVDYYDKQTEFKEKLFTNILYTLIDILEEDEMKTSLPIELVKYINEYFDKLSNGFLSPTDELKQEIIDKYITTGLFYKSEDDLTVIDYIMLGFVDYCLDAFNDPTFLDNTFTHIRTKPVRTKLLKMYNDTISKDDRQFINRNTVIEKIYDFNIKDGSLFGYKPFNPHNENIDKPIFVKNINEYNSKKMCFAYPIRCNRFVHPTINDNFKISNGWYSVFYGSLNHIDVYEEDPLFANTNNKIIHRRYKEFLDNYHNNLSRLYAIKNKSFYQMHISYPITHKYYILKSLADHSFTYDGCNFIMQDFYKVYYKNNNYNIDFYYHNHYYKNSYFEDCYRYSDTVKNKATKHEGANGSLITAKSISGQSVEMNAKLRGYDNICKFKFDFSPDDDSIFRINKFAGVEDIDATTYNLDNLSIYIKMNKKTVRISLFELMQIYENADNSVCIYPANLIDGYYRGLILVIQNHDNLPYKSVFYSNYKKIYSNYIIRIGNIFGGTKPAKTFYSSEPMGIMTEQELKDYKLTKQTNGISYIYDIETKKETLVDKGFHILIQKIDNLVDLISQDYTRLANQSITDYGHIDLDEIIANPCFDSYSFSEGLSAYNSNISTLPFFEDLVDNGTTYKYGKYAQTPLDAFNKTFGKVENIYRLSQPSLVKPVSNNFILKKPRVVEMYDLETKQCNYHLSFCYDNYTDLYTIGAYPSSVAGIEFNI